VKKSGFIKSRQIANAHPKNGPAKSQLYSIAKTVNWSLTLKISGIVVSVIGVVVAWLPLLDFYQSQYVHDEDRINRAWTLIASAKAEHSGNLGLINALEALHQRRIDLSAVKLPGAYLSHVQLPAGSLAASNFSEATLDHANLQDADLSHADLTGANLNFANLEGATLAGAILRRASLRGARLNGADLKGAKLMESDFSGSELRRADLRGADLTDAVLFRAELNGNETRLDLADLTRADLSVTNLRDAHLEGARLDHTILHGADLTRVSFLGTIFKNADLRRALLAGVNFRDAFSKFEPNFDGSNFDGSCIDETTTQLPLNAKSFYGNAAWCGPPRTPIEQIESASRSFLRRLPRRAEPFII
jgi:uncharacterized protein YjbI with pentapeptide repeats